MKKLTVALLALSVLLAFNSCGDTTDRQIETTALSGSTSTQSAVVSKTEQNVSKNLKATEKDFDTLTVVSYGIWHSSPHIWVEEGYIHNKDSDYALIEAMHMIYNDGLSLAFEIDECYGIELDWKSFLNDYSSESPVFPVDPLDMLPTDSPGVCGYIRLNADQVDWILENILSVMPDRSRIYFDLNPYDDDSTTDCYYHEGYYYYLIQEGGGGGNHPAIIDYVQQPDGSYVVKFSAYDEEYEYKNAYQILEVSAVLKEIDGKRVWSVSSVEVIDYVIE